MAELMVLSIGAQAMAEQHRRWRLGEPEALEWARNLWRDHPEQLCFICDGPVTYPLLAVTLPDYTDKTHGTMLLVPLCGECAKLTPMQRIGRYFAAYCRNGGEPLDLDRLGVWFIMVSAIDRASYTRLMVRGGAFSLHGWRRLAPRCRAQPHGGGSSAQASRTCRHSQRQNRVRFVIAFPHFAAFEVLDMEFGRSSKIRPVGAN
jgi:hypothetical protein